MKKKVLNILVVVLTLSILIEGFICFKNIKNNKVLEDIKTVDVFNNTDKTISIMIQNDDFGWDSAPKSTTWPDYTKYTYVGAECTDASGEKIIDTKQYVQFDEVNNEATITTKKTIYCTLYFAEGRPPLEVLKQYPKGGEETVTYTETNVDGMYRYKGTITQVINNFICFGTTSVDTCTSNPKNYMFRIIGITNNNVDPNLGLQAGQLKVLDSENIKYDNNWCPSSKEDCVWDESPILQKLNSEYLNSINENWQKIIDNPKWIITDNSGSWNEEVKGSYSLNHKISLMYISDWSNSYKSGYPDDGWMMQGDCSSSNNWEMEWTMTRYGYSRWDYSYAAINFSCSDASGQRQTTGYGSYSLRYRPVFYLTPDVGLVGEGTKQKPYIITSRVNA